MVNCMNLTDLTLSYYPILQYPQSIVRTEHVTQWVKVDYGVEKILLFAHSPLKHLCIHGGLQKAIRCVLLTVDCGARQCNNCPQTNIYSF